MFGEKLSLTFRKPCWFKWSWNVNFIKYQHLLRNRFMYYGAFSIQNQQVKFIGLWFKFNRFMEFISSNSHFVICAPLKVKNNGNNGNNDFLQNCSLLNMHFSVFILIHANICSDGKINLIPFSGYFHSGIFTFYFLIYFCD